MTVISAPNLQLVRAVRLSSPGGSVSLLDGSPWLLRAPVSGLSGPSASVELDTLPGVDGGFVRGEDQARAGLRLEPSQVILTAAVDAGTPELTAAVVSGARAMLNPRRYGPATIWVTLIDGSTRSLDVIHVPQAEDFAMPPWGGSSWTVVFRLLARRPLWRGAPGAAGPFAFAGGSGGELPVEFPWELAADRLLGAVSNVVIEGEEVTYPVLTVTGPATSVTVAQGDGRGYTIMPSAPLPAGATVRVRHDPLAILEGFQVTGPDGSSWSRFLGDGADLFELRPGVESLSIDVAGAAAASSAGLAWDALHWSALT